MFAITVIWAQPIKTTFGFATQSYNPTVPTVKPIPGPRGPRGLQGIQGIPGKTDTIFFSPILDNYPTIAETFQIVDDQVRPTMTKTDSIWSIMHALNAKEVYRMNDLQDNLNIHKLRASGRTKIISGIGLQVIALGVLVASEIETVTVANVMTKYEVPYTYTEYELSNVTVNTQVTIPTPPNNNGNKCGWNKKPPTPTGSVVINTQTSQPVIKPVTKTGKINFTVNDLAPVVQEYNKTPFYISAGILAGAGVVLEVLGIIDIHNANVYVTQNSAGVTFKF